MTIQERMKEEMIGLTDKEKQTISNYLIEFFKKYPTASVRLVADTENSEARAFYYGGHNFVEVSPLKFEKTKEWLLSEGLFLTVWRSPLGHFNGYHIYMHSDYCSS